MEDKFNIVTWLLTDNRIPWEDSNRRTAVRIADVFAASGLIPVYLWVSNTNLFQPIDSGFASVVGLTSPIWMAFLAVLLGLPRTLNEVTNMLFWVCRMLAITMLFLLVMGYSVADHFSPIFLELSEQVGGDEPVDLPIYARLDFWILLSSVVLLTVAAAAWRKRGVDWKHVGRAAAVYLGAIVALRVAGIVVPGEPWWFWGVTG